MLPSLLLLLPSPLLAFLLLSLFFVSWFASIHSPLFAFPGLSCVVRSLVVPSCSGLSLWPLFPFFCFRLSSVYIPVLWFFSSSVCVLSVFCDFSQLPKKTPPCSFSPPLVFSFFSTVSPPSRALGPPFFVVFSLNVLSFCPDNDHGGEAYLEMHRVGDVVHDCNRFEAVSFLLN